MLNLYRKPVTGPPDSEELLVSGPLGKYPTDWSSDGRYLLYDLIRPNHGSDIYAVLLDGPRQPVKVVETDYTEGFGQFSRMGSGLPISRTGPVASRSTSGRSQPAATTPVSRRTEDPSRAGTRMGTSCSMSRTTTG